MWIIICSISRKKTKTGAIEQIGRLEGDVMTMVAGMDDNVEDEDLKEEIMRCFSNTPTTIQAIGVLRGIQQRQNEQAHLYAARY